MAVCKQLSGVSRVSYLCSIDLSGTTGLGTVTFRLLLKVRCRFVRGERKGLQKATARNMIIANSLDYYKISRTV